MTEYAIIIHPVLPTYVNVKKVIPSRPENVLNNKKWRIT